MAKRFPGSSTPLCLHSSHSLKLGHVATLGAKGGEEKEVGYIDSLTKSGFC